jgi:hypothetical protein
MRFTDYTARGTLDTGRSNNLSKLVHSAMARRMRGRNGSSSDLKTSEKPSFSDHYFRHIPLLNPFANIPSLG